MRIAKKILLGSLEVDPDEGRIWLNDLTKCVLRICRLDFEIKSEKFDVIDIANNKAIMIEGSKIPRVEDDLNEKIEDIVQLLVLQTFQNPKLLDKKEFLDTSYEVINKLAKTLEGK